jgi:hypothetical protein
MYLDGKLTQEESENAIKYRCMMQSEVSGIKCKYGKGVWLAQVQHIRDSEKYA